MINIISKSYYSKLVSGPKKVVENFIKGLEILRYPYVINKRLDACNRLWIHDDAAALKKVGNLSKEIKVVAGPNLFVLPSDIPTGVNLSNAVYLHPSQWVKDLWQERGFNSCPIEVWPVGVDTEQFKPSQEKKELVLVYFKQRSEEDLETIENLLKNYQINFQTLRYGHYKESDYTKILGKTRYIIWLGQSESQGLALLEALSSNVPVLVCDVVQSPLTVSNNQKKLYTEVTSAPYFSNECGIKIKGLAEFSGAVSRMEQEVSSFQPRDYVVGNLGLKKQAEALLKIYEKYFNLPITSGYKDGLLKVGDWKNNSLFYRTGFYIKDVIKNKIIL